MPWLKILSFLLYPTFYAGMLRLMVPIVLGALGEIISERSGVVNIGLEGIILLGALFSTYVGHKTVNLWFAIGAGLFVGLLIGLLHALIAVYLAGDQIIDGVGLNMFALGIGEVVLYLTWGSFATSPQLPRESRVPSISGFSPFIILTIALAITSWFILEKTRWGLRLKAVGENPVAAEAAGIDVYKVRFIATMIGSVLTALAGIFLALDWLGGYTKNVSAGRGFIALALVVFSRWNPIVALGGGLIFGFCYAFSLSIPSGIIADQVLYSVPYVATLLISMGFLAKARPPAAVGRPYKRV